MSTRRFASLASDLLRRQEDDGPPKPPHHRDGPVVAFIIGLAIILLASILNAAGLNLTKLDHVRTSAIPKTQRRKDWLRPLWLLGMILYILSQLIGSTLALDYLRAEYVAPLGSTSLIFNFLFASFLVGSPVTSNDIYGTIVVIFGVIGIVAFGSINSGLAEETDAGRLTYLWRRGGWLGFFFLMMVSLLSTYIFTSELETVLTARADLSAEPFSSIIARRRLPENAGSITKVKFRIESGLLWVKLKLEAWTASHDDTQIAWTLGIGWACCGGGLAGMCLVFAKAAVKLVSGALSHENTGNQFGRLASIFTFIFLAITAVTQIICLNRGLRVYDSTLVVPVFYGVYTATGFVDSLVFNDSVDAYQTWTLFLIFVSIMILISGVVLLTLKKPEKRGGAPTTPGVSGSTRSIRSRRRSNSKQDLEQGDVTGPEVEGRELGDDEALWELGEMSDEEGDHDGVRSAGGRSDGQRTPRRQPTQNVSRKQPSQQQHPGEEGRGLMVDEEEDEEEGHLQGGSRRRGGSPVPSLASNTAAWR